MYIRALYQELYRRLQEKRVHIQVLFGPRQVGKTTLAKRLMQEYQSPSHYASADKPTLDSEQWLQQQWDIARLKCTAQDNATKQGLLILDEIQKIPNWSEIIKSCWDKDSFDEVNLKVILLGSSPLLIQQGLTESLAGRFEIIKAPHWSYQEIKQAFDVTLSQYIYFGGYPGAYEYINNEQRWKDYVMDSLIETTISRDILLMTKVEKPALLRRLFELGCSYSGQIISLQKILGQLQDRGNVTTIAHYLELLHGAGMLCGIGKYYGNELSQKASIPKLQALNTALISAQNHYSFQQSEYERDYWGRLVESAIGAHLLNTATRQTKVYYWRERNKEVDFVLTSNADVVGIEVKSGKSAASFSGIHAFQAKFNPKRVLLVGAQGIPLEEFLSQPTNNWL